MDKNIAAILRKDAKTIGVRFYADKDGVLGETEYTYVTTEPFAIGDHACVMVGRIPKVVYVARADDDLNIAPNSDSEYKWVVCKVDMAAHIANAEKNKELTEMLGKAYQHQMRQSFADTLLASLPTEARERVAGLLA